MRCSECLKRVILLFRRSDSRSSGKVYGKQEDAIPAQRNSFASSIKALTGVEINESTQMLLPNPELINTNTCLRPDFENFSIQKNLLSASSNVLSRKRYPILAGFAQAGYGKPGLSMLSNEWDTFYLLGAKLSWNIWDWNSTKKERQQFKIQSSIVNLRQQFYIDTYNAQLEENRLEIQKLQNQLEKDVEIVKLLHQVSERSISQLKNGTITSANYLTDFNNESRARLDMELRKIKLSLEKVKFYNITGNSLK